MKDAESKAVFKEADVLYRSGHYDEALVLLERLESKYPKQRRVLYPRALALAKVGRLDEALVLCDRLIDEHQYVPAKKLKASILKPPEPVAPGIGGENVSFDVLNGDDDIKLDSSMNMDSEVKFDGGLDFDDDEELSGAFAEPPVVVEQGRGRGALIAIVGVLLVAGLAAGGYFLYTQQGGGSSESEDSSDAVVASSGGAAGGRLAIDHSGPPELITLKRSNSQDGVTVNATVEYGIWTDCGSYDCFLAKFAACEPTAIRMTTMGVFVVEYQVLGAQGGVCQIEMTFVEMPMYEDWSGKSMVCPCDNTMDFIDLTEKLGPPGIMDGTLQCEGELFEAMKATLSNY